MNKPLQGVKVLDFTLLAAGPTCGRLLAEWGADVLKVEPPKGECARVGAPGKVFSPIFELYNAGKRGITVDAKTPEGIRIIYQLLEEVDVFLTSYRTAGLKRLGLDYETLHEKFPSLIWAQISGYGELGPEARTAGFDKDAYWARSGIMQDFVEAGSPVMNAPFGFGDASTSCSLAAGICAALFQRTKTGKGEKVVSSLYSQAIHCLGSTLVMVQDGEEYPVSRKKPQSPLINTFCCKDGKWFILTVLEYERFFSKLMEVIDRQDLIGSEFSTFSGMYSRFDEFVEIMDEGFARLTLEEATQRLAKYDIAHAPIRHVKDILSDPQACENEYLSDYVCPDGRVYRHAAGPVKFGKPEKVIMKSAPQLGEDSVAVLESLGYDRETIRDLLERGIITAPETETWRNAK